MKAEDRIIVALDVNDLEKAKSIVGLLIPRVKIFKIGLELITAVGGPQAVEMVRSLGGEVFYDAKFNDISKTIIGASTAVTKLGVKMLDVHCLGGSEMMKAAKNASKQIIKEQNYSQVSGGISNIVEEPLVLGVTILTSLDDKDLVEMGIFEELSVMVKYLANLAQGSGLDGVVTSPQEIEAIRNYCQPELIIVTPGIRPSWASVNNHKRTMTPEKAIEAGADYLVIGRPITQPPAEIGSSVEAVKRIIDEVASALDKKE